MTAGNERDGKLGAAGADTVGRVERFVQTWRKRNAPTRQASRPSSSIRSASSLLKRFATPEEVAALVVYVCSPRASATNGAALRVDGAWSDPSCEPDGLDGDGAGSRLDVVAERHRMAAAHDIIAQLRIIMGQDLGID